MANRDVTPPNPYHTLMLHTNAELKGCKSVILLNRKQKRLLRIAAPSCPHYVHHKIKAFYTTIILHQNPLF